LKLYEMPRFTSLSYTPGQTEQLVKMLRLNLYNPTLLCGAQAIGRKLHQLGLRPLPSRRTIKRILNRHGFTHEPTGLYEY
jgi:hypothetical protein